MFGEGSSMVQEKKGHYSFKSVNSMHLLLQKKKCFFGITVYRNKGKKYLKYDLLTLLF